MPRANAGVPIAALRADPATVSRAFAVEKSFMGDTAPRQQLAVLD